MMEEMAQFEARAALLRRWTRQQLIAGLPQLVSLSTSCGIDVRERVQEFVRTLAPQMVPPRIPTVHGDPPADEEISRLYDLLRTLQIGQDEQAYQGTLSRLRELQGQEAARLDAVFQQAWGDPGGDFARAKAKAEQLIKRR